MTGERRLAGLFTSAAYHALVHDVPLLRGRVDGMLRRSGLDANSHDGKALLAILESYPRDELFQIEEDTLYDHALGILQLQERRRVALFARRDAVGRFATCLVFAPRERFDASAQRPLRGDPRAGVARQGDVGRLLDQQRLGARPVALHAEARRPTTRRRPTSPSSSRRWPRPRPRGATAFAPPCRRASAKSRAAPPPAAGATGSRRSIATASTPTQAMADLGPLQAALDGQPFGVRLDREAGLPAHRFTLRLFHPREPIALSDILPPAGTSRAAGAERSAVPAAAPRRQAARRWRCRC